MSTEPGGWAHFDHVKMPEYRWGIFLADAVPDRRIPAGDDAGKPVWHEVPGEHRASLRRLIVTQGDTEPASVEQQRKLGHKSPSLYDLRNLFQVNVEEGRHLWAMVYLLHSYFGRDGREEAEALLERRSGDVDRPRILEAFNAPIDDWLSFFMFTFFTDRDGKYQLLALSESAFDPLSRTTRFMLTEEAHHMFVGETGIERVVRRTAEALREHPDAQARDAGVIDLDLLQRYINFWYSASLDLFGGEISSNAARYFAAGLKGRANEERYADHLALDASFEIEVYRNGRMETDEIPLRNAMNAVLGQDYSTDCQRGMDRFNKVLRELNVDFELVLPSSRFNRSVGIHSGFRFDPAGEPISEEEWNRHSAKWLPTQEDRDYVHGLMSGAVTEPGKMANWIAPPRRGVKGKPADFEYVRFD
jgi:benzoyl-CoA 2,3-dioxygenase component B